MKEKYFLICDRCGCMMVSWRCEWLCENCGRRMDCTDGCLPTRLQIERLEDLKIEESAILQP